ncbi:MAG: fatty acyl-AMP ligase [Pirellulaceae bacterium]
MNKHRSWAMDNGRSFESLPQTLQKYAQAEPDRCGYTFVVDGTVERDKLTYGQLHQQSCEIAVMLRRVLEPGDRAILLYPPGLSFVAAFFGCLYAGVIAVPAYPPQPSRPERSLALLEPIVTQSGAKLVLCVEDACESLRSLLDRSAVLATCRVLATDYYGLEDVDAWQPPACSADTIAFLQYTSGSTAAPRGVAVSHGNIVHNLFCIQQVSAHETANVLVSWLPTYHDMGLFAGVLFPLFNCCPSYLMSPTAFLQKPVRWLQAISTFRGTNSGGPNFAFDMCVQKTTAEERRQLDLSSWQIAYNGAEPVRRATLEAFANAFRECGFRQTSLFPVYGLAESTVFVTGKPFSDAQNVDNFVSCGAPGDATEIVITHPRDLVEMPSGQVGEIWVRGPSVASGYWNLPHETQRTFNAYLNGNVDLSNSQRGPYLRTGDLGYQLDGELFVTGRLKDLIIMHGRNLYPQDIENSVEACHIAVRPTCSVAIGLDSADGPRLVILAEVNRRGRSTESLNPGSDKASSNDVNEIMGRIVEAVAEDHGVEVHTVCLLAPGGIPKTSSGKVQRHTCLELFTNGQLVPLAAWSKQVEKVE